MPQCHANCQTVSRRFQQWCQRDVLTQLANTLREEGVIDERERFIDATFAAAKVNRRHRGDDGLNLRGIVINHSRRDFLLLGNVHAWLILFWKVSTIDQTVTSCPGMISLKLPFVL